ncbi:MAG: tRNA (adenosine(37)-N6)-threonylcarbamoyltransferase complex dimerization subunit type 1 TsaB, partial [Betaproteobacteria bacterium]|nr:tRNA (adenosine(37)-N6)-threonylcarbamoyltransferase complex dimerization subunit type 1 TsaB [Betaproteobacteria bacterium]
MLILALETSTELGSCALWRDGAVLERRCPSGRPHSETLLPLVRELLGEAGVGIAALDAIAFGVGPGAFTGLRVACGAAQGLAVAAGRPLLPVTSLEAMALQAGDGEVLALLDARMG